MKVSASRSAGQTDCEDARFAVAQFSSWIMNADTKAGLLLAASTVLLGGAVTQRDRLVGLVPPGAEPRAFVALFAFAWFALSLSASMYTLLHVLKPTVARGPFSRFSWPSVAVSSVHSLVGRPALSERREAWHTARSLAVIANVKFRRLRWALICWASAASALLVAVFVAP